MEHDDLEIAKLKLELDVHMTTYRHHFEFFLKWNAICLLAVGAAVAYTLHLSVRYYNDEFVFVVSLLAFVASILCFIGCIFGMRWCYDFIKNIKVVCDKLSITPIPTRYLVNIVTLTTLAWGAAIFISFVRLGVSLSKL